MKLSFDLHLHSCLSPCGDDDMTPNNIANMSALIGLDVIAISDHNSAKNLPAFFEVCKDLDVVAIPAIEYCTAEEVHLLCLFETLQDAIDCDEETYKFLPPIKNKAAFFGNQLILDENDKLIREEPFLLINALTLNISQLIKIVRLHNGFVIPAHIDKTSNSIISNLGFIPPEYCFTVAEYRNINSSVKFDGYRITNSDAHSLDKINEPINFIEVEEKSIKSVLNFFKSFG